MIRGAFSSAIIVHLSSHFSAGERGDLRRKKEVTEQLWMGLSEVLSQIPQGCLYCPLLTVFFRPSALTAYADSPWGAFGHVSSGPGGVSGGTSSLGDSSTSAAN